MKIKYVGPNDHVIVGPFGRHDRDQIKEYPDEFGKELLASSQRQRFEGAVETMTIAELRAKLAEAKIDVPANTKKAELVELYQSIPEE